MQKRSKRKSGIILLISGCLLFSCNKTKYFEGQDTFYEDFEGYTLADDIFEGPQDSLWSYYQLTADGNQFNLDIGKKVSGNVSMLFHAEKIDGVSKCSIAKQNMAFWEGETMEVTAWYYLKGNDAADWMFLMDVEEQTAIGAGPGTRVAIAEDDYLVIEHKYPEPNYYQAEETKIKFPRDQWVELKLTIHLSKRKRGWIKLQQDGVCIIERENVQTMPRDLLYATQGTKGIYSSVEVGITANSRSAAHDLYVDDVNIRIIP